MDFVNIIWNHFRLETFKKNKPATGEGLSVPLNAATSEECHQASLKRASGCDWRPQGVGNITKTGFSKGFGEGDRGLFQDGLPVFAWSNWGTPQEISGWLASDRLRFEPINFRIQVRLVTDTVTGCVRHRFRTLVHLEDIHGFWSCCGYTDEDLPLLPHGPCVWCWEQSGSWDIPIVLKASPCSR